MYGYFWNTVLAVNSALWFASIAFLSYATGMLIIRFEWKQFLLALTIFTGLTFIALVLAALAHD